MADSSAQRSNHEWKVLIVDDERAVHDVTEMVLADFRFENQPLQFLRAYTAVQARELLAAHPDTALILLDVVMESDRAGLDLVREIRENMANRNVRIVLRTGQPGEAPEDRVIVEYDINGYKEKTELTAQKLFTTVYAALRAYRDIMTIERNREGLERVIESSAHIFEHETSSDFASALLEQVANLLRMDQGVMYCRPARDGDEVQFVVAAATGEYQRYLSSRGGSLPAEIAALLSEALEGRRNLFNQTHCVLHFSDPGYHESLLYVGQCYQPSGWEKDLVELFCRNVSIALENMRLNNDLRDAQLDLVNILAGAVESRSRETGNHIRRVAKLSRMLAALHGCDETTAAMIEIAAPLHDIGKICIPEEVLHKPGKHDAQECAVMREHAQIGWEILQASDKPIIQLGAQISRDHHENWDGSGYPDGRCGEEISLAGRIIAVADVFDALGSERCYKQPWAEDDIRAYFQRERGRKFEPALVDLLLDNWDEAWALRAQYPD